MHENAFGGRALPRPAEGVYSAFPGREKRNGRGSKNGKDGTGRFTAGDGAIAYIKIAPRMHQNPPFSTRKSKNFLGRGCETPQHLSAFGVSILAPSALDRRPPSTS